MPAADGANVQRLLQVVVLSVEVDLRLDALHPIEQFALKALHSSDVRTCTIDRMSFRILHVHDLVVVAQNLERVRNTLVIRHAVVFLNV